MGTMKFSNEFRTFGLDGLRSKEDLIAVVAGWQLDADRICMFSEDLEEDALEDACRELFGEEEGARMFDMIVEAQNTGADRDEDLWNAGIHRFLGYE